MEVTRHASPFPLTLQRFKTKMNITLLQKNILFRKTEFLQDKIFGRTESSAEQNLRQDRIFSKTEEYIQKNIKGRKQ